MIAVAAHFRETLDNARMQDGRVFYAAKANKANAFLAASAVSDCGVDVSSVYELRAALDQGVLGTNISVSGPTKRPELLTLAMLHNSKIAVDEPSELPLITGLAKELSLAHPVRVLLRLSSSETSRFGMTEQAINAAMERLKDLQSGIYLEGFSFHVSGYDTKDRVLMIEAACEALRRAYSAGFSPTHINIGGGFQVTYADSDNWDLERATQREFIGNFKPRFVYPYASRPAVMSSLNKYSTLQERPSQMWPNNLNDLS